VADQTSPDALARYYDLDLAEDPGDLAMYLAFADATSGPVLELMAGTGRLSVPLAAAGHKVVAVDRDPHMLARAATRWAGVKDRAPGARLDLVEADITRLDLKKRFGLVIVALNSLLLLDGQDAQRSAFATIAHHLKRNGRAVVDMWLPAPEDLALYDGRLVLDWVRHDEEATEWVAKTTAARYQPASRKARVTSFFDAWRDGAAPRRVMRQDTISFISSYELVAFAEAAGLVVETFAGDYELGQFAGDSDRVVMVCGAGSD
jgi:SAM-dependent methyltransferase